MLASNRKRRDQFYRHGRMSNDPIDIAEAAGRKRGRIVARGVSSDRPFNVLDAAHMGQEDYRDDKLMATRETFERRANLLAGVRFLGMGDDMDVLYEFYQRGYGGTVKL